MVRRSALGIAPATAECTGTATNPCGWSAHRMALPAWRSSAAGGAISSRTASAAAPAAATSAVGASDGKARRGGADALGEQRIIRSEAVSAARWAHMPRLLGLHPIHTAYTAAIMVASYLNRGDYGCILCKSRHAVKPAAIGRNYSQPTQAARRGCWRRAARRATW
jgi:hypothetical protein